MYASDVTKRNRDQNLYVNLQLQIDQFLSGKSIRILRQSGGTDYAYMMDLAEGEIKSTLLLPELPIQVTSGNGDVPSGPDGLIQISFAGITDVGSLPADASGNTYTGFLDASGNRNSIDDAGIQIPTGGMDFFFFGTNYGAADNIYWNTNNAITFGQIPDQNTVSISKDTWPAILLGNYDRYCTGLYYKSFSTQTKGGAQFKILVIQAHFSNYFTDTTGSPAGPSTAGKYHIRLIREQSAAKRQWVEVSVISGVNSPGYSNNSSVSYPSGTDGSGNRIDANSQPIDSTKNSPYDITNGTNFINVVGTTYSAVSPATGTTFVYQSDSLGNSWQFFSSGYLNIY
jgi:hypothetical protein